MRHFGIWWSVIFNVQSQFKSIFLIHLSKSFFGGTCSISCYQLIESLWFTKNYFDVTNIDKDNFKYFCQDIDIYIYICNKYIFGFCWFVVYIQKHVKTTEYIRNMFDSLMTVWLCILSAEMFVILNNYATCFILNKYIQPFSGNPGK